MRTVVNKAVTRAFVAIALALPSGVMAQQACTTYSVSAGDTLGSISEAAYGTYDYQVIFNANRDALADNPNNLDAGLQLILPCKDGRLTPDTVLNTIITQQETKQTSTRKKNNVFEPPLKFVTANNWMPFSDESLLGNGIFPRIAATAMQRGGNDREYTLAFIDDWQSHLDVLLPSGAFDISIAWESPDCKKLDLLSEESVKRCTELDYSLPIYELVNVFYTTNENEYANAKNYSDYQGARICRPDAWGTGDLEVEGLAEPFITMVRPSNPIDCAEMLLAGEVDVYTIEVETVAANFSELGATDKVTQSPYLSVILPYHFITSKTNPRGRVYISMLNRGITEMRESGEWYDVVATGLADFNATSN
jgi:polar amino acid transport system substrate-binding protein